MTRPNPGESGPFNRPGRSPENLRNLNQHIYAMETFRVLTFNVWGLKYLSQKRTERLAALTNLLLTSTGHSYDVICLQELWVEADFIRLKNALRHKYPHSAYWPNSVVGSGLAVLSKWDIIGRDFTAFGVCGEPGEIGGDWYAGKGVGNVTLKVEKLGEVEIFNTHFFAKGGEEGPESLRSVRISNAWEMAKVVRKAVAGGRHVIATGDFNSSPHSLPMRIMFQHGDLIDTWASTHPAPPADPPRHTTTDKSAQAAVDLFGLTVDTPSNTWSAGKKLDNFALRWLGKRLDYILYNSAPLSGSPGFESTSGTRLSIQSTVVVLTGTVPGQDFSYSDHFGLEATFAIVSSDSSAESRPITRRLSSEDIYTAREALFCAFYSSRSRTRRHVLYLLASIIGLLLAVLGPSWISIESSVWKWGAFIAAPIAAISAWGGTMALCVGIIYGIRERGRLTNFIEELECAR
ncbi:hypothetical protein M408DRAFT_21007 [Serendipita vermifera MAFF 305830]|uniref:Endonuclease/exonuclease/phosphatase domain-containing protein n=1 Tax=Serendipita vermifera MAFF 305830 TaxID=933852 RepID=A0A0C3BI49_SERVB|nr:hypothetical protein M408DRAFT_21007 [Serendipita vermifera MAFF 305830]